MASELVISDHMTVPELPEPDDATQAMQSQHIEFLTHFPSSLSHRLLRSKGLKDATCVVWFGDDWDCSVGSPPEAMIM